MCSLKIALNMALMHKIVDAAVVGSRCRGLEREGSDLDVVVELSTNEREDDLFNTFNEDGLHIGGIKVDINPITEQRTGSLKPIFTRWRSILKISGWQGSRQKKK